MTIKLNRVEKTESAEIEYSMEIEVNPDDARSEISISELWLALTKQQ